MAQFFVDTQQDSKNQLTKDYLVATLSRSQSPPLCKTKLLTSCQCRLHRLALAREYDFSRDDIITKQLNSQPLRGPQPVPIQLGDLAGGATSAPLGCLHTPHILAILRAKQQH